MTTTTQARPEPKRDRWGRYVLPDPETGKERSWTRATTVASTLSDRFGLEQWAQRNTVLGIAARPDLYALAASCKPEDKDQLNRIAADAQEAAKSRSGANLGTALHRILERIDSGEDLDVPHEWRGDVDAYCNALVDNRVKVHTEWMETIVVIPKAGIAGTLDRLVTVGGNLVYTIGDIKTGKDAPAYPHEIAIQLALYANATHAWDGSEYHDMPPIDRDRALIMHVPVGEARCDLHWVDIAAGREAALMALQVRDWRKRRDLSYPLRKEVGEALEESLANTDDW